MILQCNTSRQEYPDVAYVRLREQTSDTNYIVKII